MSDEAATTTCTELSEFLEQHRACSKARPFAARYSTLAEAWDNCHVPDWLIWSLKKADLEDLLALRVWACWCVRQAVDFMTAPESRQALELVECFIEDKATSEELAEVAGPAARLSESAWPTLAEAWAARAAPSWRRFAPCMPPAPPPKPWPGLPKIALPGPPSAAPKPTSSEN